MVESQQIADPIRYQASRPRFVIGTALLVPVTGLVLAGAYDELLAGSVGSFLFWLALGGLYLFLSYVFITKLIWPPQVEISPTGFRYTNRGLRSGRDYRWEEVEGPTETRGAYGVPLVEMAVKSSGQKLRFPPSHFGASYGEMAAVINDARAGGSTTPEEWREEHPRNRLKEWMLDWGIPIFLGGAAGIVLSWFKH